MIVSLPSRIPAATGASAGATALRRQGCSDAQVRAAQEVIEALIRAVTATGCRSYLLGVRTDGACGTLIRVSARDCGRKPVVGDLPPGCTAGNEPKITTAWAVVPPPPRYGGMSHGQADAAGAVCC